MPTYRKTTVAVPLATSRLSPTRLIRTSPASPEADSRLVKEITATVSAKTRSDQVGAVPRWIGSSSVCGLKNSTRPSTTMKACSARSPASRIADAARAAPAEAADVAEHDQRDERERERRAPRRGRPRRPQKTRRYCVAEKAVTAIRMM